MGIGAYTAAILTSSYNVSFVFALIAGSVSAAFFGLIVGLPTLRLKGDYLAIATLGFGEIIRVSVLNMGITGGAFGLRGIPKETNLAVAVSAAILICLASKRLTKSRFGRALAAIREDEVAAEAMGLTKAGTTARLRKVLEQYGLPIDVDASAEELIPYISNDKKMRGNHITLVIIEEIGKARLLPLAAEDLPKYIRKKDAQ